MTLQSVQSNWGIKHLANRVRSAFQEIIGDCAKLKIIEAGTDSTTISSSGGIKSVVRKRYRLTFSDEKASCKCNDCWQVLKNAIRNVSPVVQVRYLIDKDNAFGEITGSNRNIYINSGVDVDLPEQNPKGGYRDKRVPFPIVLWHEGIGHSHQGLGHPDVPANHAGSWDGLYVDPTIHEENRARNCTRLMNERYGGFLGLFGRELGDRRPTYYL